MIKIIGWEKSVKPGLGKGGGWEVDEGGQHQQKTVHVLLLLLLLFFFFFLSFFFFFFILSSSSSSFVQILVQADAVSPKGCDASVHSGVLFKAPHKNHI